MPASDGGAPREELVAKTKDYAIYLPTPEKPRHLPGSAPAVVQRFASECEALAAEKDALYGGAWQRQGYMGNMARVLSKVERLRNMVWGDVTPEGTPEETVLDTLRDLANLCAFMSENVQNDNRWGER